jgi:hypothetical protein
MCRNEGWTKSLLNGDPALPCLTKSCDERTQSGEYDDPMIFFPSLNSDSVHRLCVKRVSRAKCVHEDRYGCDQSALKFLNPEI